MNVRPQALKSLAFGVVWMLAAAAAWLYSFSPVSDVRLVLTSRTAKGTLYAAEEEPQDTDSGGVQWLLTAGYYFTLPSGERYDGAFKGVGRLPSEWDSTKLPREVEVEFVPGNPKVNRLKGTGSSTLLGWSVRTTVLTLLFWLFAYPGWKVATDSLRTLRLGYDPADDPLWWPTSDCQTAQTFIVAAEAEAEAAGLTGFERTFAVIRKARTFAFAHVDDCEICKLHREEVRLTNLTVGQ